MQDNFFQSNSKCHKIFFLINETNQNPEYQVFECHFETLTRTEKEIVSTFMLLIIEYIKKIIYSNL
jgi:hypothetical protein